MLQQNTGKSSLSRNFKSEKFYESIRKIYVIWLNGRMLRVHILAFKMAY